MIKDIAAIVALALFVTAIGLVAAGATTTCIRSGNVTRCYDYDTRTTTRCTDWGERVRCTTHGVGR